MSGLKTIIELYPRRQFNPAKTEDLQAYKNFLKNSHWAPPCPFVLEIPYLSIPHMIADKIAANVVKVKLKF